MKLIQRKPTSDNIKAATNSPKEDLTTQPKEKYHERAEFLKVLTQMSDRVKVYKRAFYNKNTVFNK